MYGLQCLIQLFLSPASWFIQGSPYGGCIENGAIVPAFLDRYLGLWRVLFQVVRQTEIFTHDMKSWEGRCTQWRTWPCHHSLPNVNPPHLEVSFKMVLWILICSLTLKPVVVYPVYIFKTILEVILITHSSLQHILFPVQTDSVFS